MSVFNKVRIKKPEKTAFSMPSDNKLSFEMGKLIPFQVLECMPGDVWNLQAEALIRFAPLVAPVMHSVNVHIEHFFVPNRILWQNWEDFVSPIEVGTVPPAMPVNRSANTTVSVDWYGVGTLADYLGLPSTNMSGASIPESVHQLFPFAAYQQIWNDYYRDQNLQPYNGVVTGAPWGGPKVSQRLQNGVIGSGLSPNLYMLRNRSWQHDYFTSALPFAQKGPEVMLPAGTIPNTMVLHNSINPGITTWDSSEGVSTVASPRALATGGVNVNSLYIEEQNIAGISINEFRLLNVTQRFLERQARSGSRYVEFLRSQYGVVSSDKRLQRPEFIGSQRFPVVISETLQTSSTDNTSPQGTMAGHGIAASRGRGFRHYCEEHGYIISLISVTPTTAYSQGMPRHFTRSTQFDIPLPIFAHIGEQAIKNKEIYYSNTPLTDEMDFGYIPRFSEMRYQPSEIHGEFRTSLDHWHFGRKFSSTPGLNAQFLECVPPTDPFAVQTAGNQNIWAHVFRKNRVYRPLPKYGTPTL